MSTSVSAHVQFDTDTTFDVTGYPGVTGAGPFVGIRASDTGASVTIVLRDHAAITTLRAALDDADAKLTAARVSAALVRAAS